MSKIGYHLKVITPPEDLVVSVDEVKAQARLSLPNEADPFEGAEDDTIELYIRSAIDYLCAPQGYLGRSMVTQKLQMGFDATPDYMVKLKGAPVQELLEIKYLTEDGVETVDLDDVNVEFTNDDAWVWPNGAWPRASGRPGVGRYKFIYHAGYGGPGDVPAILRHAVVVLAATYYRDRENSVVGMTINSIPHLANQLTNWRLW